MKFSYHHKPLNSPFSASLMRLNQKKQCILAPIKMYTHRDSDPLTDLPYANANKRPQNLEPVLPITLMHSNAYLYTHHD